MVKDDDNFLFDVNYVHYLNSRQIRDHFIRFL